MEVNCRGRGWGDFIGSLGRGRDDGDKGEVGTPRGDGGRISKGRQVLSVFAHTRAGE